MTISVDGEISPLLGGPLYRLYRRVGLLRTALDRVKRRMAIVAAFVWLPLCVLAFQAPSGGVRFLYDFEAQIRFLVAMPLLILAEAVVDARLRKTIRQFLDGGLVPPEDQPRFDAALALCGRRADSAAIEIILLVLVYTVGHVVWRDHIALGQSTWFAQLGDTGLRYTAAGVWYAFVGVPLFQFLLVRWYVRLFLWFQFLWRVSRLRLRLDAAHPDRAGGLGFVGNSSYAFGTLLFAQGAQLAGMMANRIFHDGQTFLSFKVDMGVSVVVLLALVLGPLTVFTPVLVRVHKEGLRTYGLLANRYVREFRAKWIEGGAPPGEALMGSSDLQSLADLGNSYGPVREMRGVPFSWNVVTKLALVTVSPMLPLTLTVVPLEKVVDHLLSVLF